MNCLLYRTDTASAEQVTRHLLACDELFLARLRERTVIEDYAKKLVTHALRYEAWIKDSLIGLLAGYCNDAERSMAYVSNLSIIKDYEGHGIARHLMGSFIERARDSGFQRISLEVFSEDQRAIRFYERSGFVPARQSTQFTMMNLMLK